MSVAAAPAPGSVERWAYDYVLSTSLAEKLAPPPPPARWEDAPPARRLGAPGRPAELSVQARSAKTPGPVALRDRSRRAALFHTFLHHELQAAELMAWALLAFPGTEIAFRRGLVAILLDEARHMQAYAGHIVALGHRFGDFPVRDWFWQRVPAARTPAQFVAVMGMGLEGGNLDHADRFSLLLREAGDDAGAAIEDRIGEEEIGHVRFAVRWFERWTGSADFATWASHLPAPLSPLLMRGHPVARAARLRAGLPERFVEELERWSPSPGS